MGLLVDWHSRGKNLWAWKSLNKTSKTEKQREKEKKKKDKYYRTTTKDVT